MTGAQEGPDRTSGFGDPVVATRGGDDAAPLVVLLHGRGADESTIIGLSDHLSAGPGYAAVRAPIAEGGGYAWFANRGIGRPVAESLADTLAWFKSWLQDTVPVGRPVYLVGFSGGAAFAGGLILDQPARYAGAAVLFGNLPFDSGLPTTAGRLGGVRVFAARGDHDRVIPVDLLDRTWEYLHGDSGALAVTRRDPVGHELTPITIAALSEWLTGCIERSDEPDPGR